MERLFFCFLKRGLDIQSLMIADLTELGIHYHIYVRILYRLCS